MTSHERQILILFKALAEALKHVPGRRLDIAVDDFELRRDLVAQGPDSLRVIVSKGPDGAFNRLELFRFMRQEDYEKWCEEQRQPPKPPSRKMYLE